MLENACASSLCFFLKSIQIIIIIFCQFFFFFTHIVLVTCAVRLLLLPAAPTSTPMAAPVQVRSQLPYGPNGGPPHIGVGMRMWITKTHTKRLTTEKTKQKKLTRIFNPSTHRRRWWSWRRWINGSQGWVNTGAVLVLCWCECWCVCVFKSHQNSADRGRRKSDMEPRGCERVSLGHRYRWWWWPCRISAERGGWEAGRRHKFQNKTCIIAPRDVTSAHHVDGADPPSIFFSSMRRNWINPSHVPI